MTQETRPVRGGSRSEVAKEMSISSRSRDSDRETGVGLFKLRLRSKTSIGDQLQLAANPHKTLITLSIVAKPKSKVWHLKRHSLGFE